METRDRHSEPVAKADRADPHVENDFEDVINLVGSGPVPIEERDTEEER
jgi:hypothetical protein